MSIPAIEAQQNSVNPNRGFGLDRAGVLVYLQAPQGSSIGRRMSQKSGLMRGKRGVILGVANNRSIAWDTAKA